MPEHQERNAAAPATAANQGWRDILEQIGNTGEIRRLSGNLIPELIRLWAISGKSAGPVTRTTRNKISRMAGASIKNALLDKKALAEAPPLHALAGDPDFTNRLSAQAGEAMTEMLTVLVKTAEEINALGTKEKKELVQTLVHRLSSGKSAEILTICCRAVNDIHRDEPDFLSRVLAPEFENWIRHLDFGELKEMFASGSPGVSALIGMINTVMWEYPAKVIATLSLVPSILNMAVDALAQVLDTFNQKGSPDLVADVMLSVLRETDASAISHLINQMAEMARKFHVGSALIGEPGSPRAPKEINALLTAIIDRIDGEVLWKAGTALAEIKEQARCALADVMADHPDLLAGGIDAKASAHNARIRGLSHKLSTLESLEPEAINNALLKATTSLDMQETAHLINTSAMLLNSLLDHGGDEIADKIVSFTDALDTGEVCDLLEKTGEIAGSALLPLARVFVPPLAKGALKALTAGDDEFENMAQTARQLLVSLVKDREADHNG